MDQPVSSCSDDELFQELQRRVKEQLEIAKVHRRNLVCERAALEEDQQAARRDIEKMREEFENERAQLKEARDQIYKLLDGTGDDVVEMNVGGQIFSASRSTLVQVEGSFLSAMFSGRWDKGQKRDSAGRVFLDADPYCFSQLLSLLRLRLIANPGEPLPMPDIAKDKQKEFKILLNYFLTGMVLEETETEVGAVVFKNIAQASGVCQSKLQNHGNIAQASGVCQSKLQNNGARQIQMSSSSGSKDLETILGAIASESVDNTNWQLIALSRVGI